MNSAHSRDNDHITEEDIDRIVNLKREPSEAQWPKNELRKILIRASKLPLDDLQALLGYVGINFEHPEDLDTIECLEVIDEADSLEKILEYLDAHGV